MLKIHTYYGNLNWVDAIRVTPNDANVVLAPARSPVYANRTIELCVFHAAFVHQHEVLLRETAKTLNVELTWVL